MSALNAKKIWVFQKKDGTVAFNEYVNARAVNILQPTQLTHEYLNRLCGIIQVFIHANNRPIELVGDTLPDWARDKVLATNEAVKFQPFSSVKATHKAPEDGTSVVCNNASNSK